MGNCGQLEAGSREYKGMYPQETCGSGKYKGIHQKGIVASKKLALRSINGCTSRGLVDYKLVLGSIKGCISSRLVASYKLALRSIMGCTSS